MRRAAILSVCADLALFAHALPHLRAEALETGGWGYPIRCSQETLKRLTRR